jgi:hypothetical protein
MQRGSVIYTEGYKNELFYLWWKMGKPAAGRFILEIRPQEDGKTPNQLTVQRWITEEWEERAKPLEDEIRANFEKDLVAEKIAMYREQAAQAKDLRKQAFNWLVEHADELTPSTAVRLWETCINIEHTVSGVPEALDKMMNMDNEELEEAARELLLEINESGIEE